MPSPVASSPGDAAELRKRVGGNAETKETVEKQDVVGESAKEPVPAKRRPVFGSVKPVQQMSAELKQRQRQENKVPHKSEFRQKIEVPGANGRPRRLSPMGPGQTGNRNTLPVRKPTAHYVAVSALLASTKLAAHRSRQCLPGLCVDSATCSSLFKHPTRRIGSNANNKRVSSKAETQWIG